MNKRTLTLGVILSFAVMLLVGIGAFVLNAPPATASEPGWRQLTFESAYAATSTADQTLLAAPGASYSWMITSVWYNVDVAEASKVVRIEDLAGTPIVAVSIPLTTVKEGTILFGDGVMFSTNSGVQCDFTSTTASCAFVVNAYKIRNP